MTKSNDHGNAKFGLPGLLLTGVTIIRPDYPVVGAGYGEGKPIGGGGRSETRRPPQGPPRAFDFELPDQIDSQADFRRFRQAARPSRGRTLKAIARVAGSGTTLTAVIVSLRLDSSLLPATVKTNSTVIE
jgi:hypothetical protein